MINRNLINPDILFYNGWSNKTYPINYDEFCNYIDKWKALLVNELDFQPRTVVSFGAVTLNAKILALQFAVWELGGSICRFPVLWFPSYTGAHVWSDVRPDLFIWDQQLMAIEKDPNRLEIRSWSTMSDIIYADGVKHLPLNATTLDILSYTKPQSRPDPAIGPHDTCWIDYDPVTGNHIEFTHDHVYGLSRRNAAILGLRGTVGVNTHNCNHETSLINYTLPACFACKSLNMILIPDYKEHFPAAPIVDWFIKACEPEGKKVIFIRSLDILQMFLDKHEFKDVHWIVMKEPYDERVYRFVHERDIKLTIPTGNIAIGSDLIFLNKVHDNDKFEEGYLGKIPDTFYENMYNRSTGELLLRSKYLGGWISYPDKMEFSDGRWISEPKRHPYHASIKKILNHEDFEIISYIGRLYLVVFKKLTKAQQEKLEPYHFNDIRDQVSPNIYTEAAPRYRDFHAMAETMFLGWDTISDDRIRFGGYETY